MAYRRRVAKGIARGARKRHDAAMTGFILRSVVTAIALWIAVALIPGLSARDMGALMLAAIVLGLVNATLRPVAVILSIPLTILTFGLFLLVVNAAMLGLVAWLLPGFSVAGFGSALFGAIVVSLVSWAIQRVAGEKALRIPRNAARPAHATTAARGPSARRCAGRAGPA